MKRDEPKWLELAVAADASVVSFHGKSTLRRYVLTLLNIVSAIYGDPTLGAKIQFVILRQGGGRRKRRRARSDRSVDIRISSTYTWNDELDIVHEP